MKIGIQNATGRISEITSRIEEILQSAKPDKSSFGEVLSEELSPLANTPEEFRSMIREAAEKYQLPPELLDAVVKQESNYNPNAKSHKGAEGLMQIIPSTQKMLGVDDPYDPKQSIEGGARYLRMNLDRFQGDVRKALAAYNAGPGAVEKFKGVPPYPETEDYVTKILGSLGVPDSEMGF